MLTLLSVQHAELYVNKSESAVTVVHVKMLESKVSSSDKQHDIVVLQLTELYVS